MGACDKIREVLREDNRVPYATRKAIWAECDEIERCVERRFEDFFDTQFETCHYLPNETGFTWRDENDVEHYEEDSASDECWTASCDVCGHVMMVGDEGWFKGFDDIKEWFDEDGAEHHGYDLEPIFNHCPCCGRIVVGSELYERLLAREGNQNA